LPCWDTLALVRLLETQTRKGRHESGDQTTGRTPLPYGVGSTFWIELPINILLGEEHEGALADGTTATERLEAAQHTVLYIEDNPSNLKLVAQILGRRKHIHLLTAHS
jgi:hypothetical protein